VVADALELRARRVERERGVAFENDGDGFRLGLVIEF